MGLKRTRQTDPDESVIRVELALDVFQITSAAVDTTGLVIPDKQILEGDRVKQLAGVVA